MDFVNGMVKQALCIQEDIEEYARHSSPAMLNKKMDSQRASRKQRN